MEEDDVMRNKLMAGLVLAALPAAAQVTATAVVTQPATDQPTQATRRIELPGGEGQPFPYTIEVPAAWQVRTVEGAPGVFLGPATGDPQKDPGFVYVRISPAPLAEPEKVVASIRASDEQNAGWSAPLVEVREVGGATGVLVRMESGEGAAARTTLALKLPLPKTSVDFMASAPSGEFEKLRPLYEQVLFSVKKRS